MKRKLISVIVVFTVVLGFGIGCSLFAPSIVGEWEIDDAVAYYFDTTTSTITNTLSQIMTFNKDNTFSQSGTSQWEGMAEQTVVSAGTYDYNKDAGTLAMTFTSMKIDGGEMTPLPEVPVTTCVIEGDTMTMTSPVDDPQPYTPAEPLVYTRL